MNVALKFSITHLNVNLFIFGYDFLFIFQITRHYFSIDIYTDNTRYLLIRRNMNESFFCLTIKNVPIISSATITVQTK